jgi:TolB-like protein/Flp pilus assembly protein TadD
VAVAASVLVLVAVGIALGLAVWPRETVAPVRTGPIRSVAVLPLDNFSKDAGQDYFVDGMTEALIADLSKIRALRVISRTSVMRYKGTKKPLADIARELNVDAILEGSVLHAGDRVRITAQLVDAADDRHLWSESYERDTRDVLAIQREVALAVAGSVQLTVSPEEAARLANRRVEPRAYELYLRGLYQYNQGDLDTSLKTFEQAVAADPNYAPAYAGQARGYFFIGLFGMLPPQEAFPKMKSLALEALKRDAFSSDGHGYLALATLHYDLDWGEADREFRRSLDLNPSNAEIRHLYAHYLMGVGRRKESVAESRRAVELDPLGLVLTTCLGWHELFVRAYPQAAEAALQGVGMEPSFGWAHTILGWAYEQQGKRQEAIAEFQTALKLWPDSALNLSALGHAYAVSGRGREAEALLAKLLDQSKQSYVSPYDLAALSYGLGRIDDALAWLERAYQRRAGFIPYLNLDPRFDGLRSDARFRDLLTRIGFPE